MGKLFLFPLPLGELSDIKDIPQFNLSLILPIRYFIVEEIKSARRYLRALDREFPIDDCEFFILNEHTSLDQLVEVSQKVKNMDAGLMSEAGLPCVADPGSTLVKLAHEIGIEVVPLSGPSSIFMALMASGLNGQRFSFLGYLEIQKDKRKQQIKRIELRSHQESTTQIFIEAPYRNNALFSDIIEVCDPATFLTLAVNISCPSQKVKTMTIEAWRKMKINIDKKPAVFLLLKT